jgi:cytochrome-b5 reductase
VLGWYYMRYQSNLEKHREWMLRAYVLSYAIVLMRPGVILYLALDPSTSQGDALAIVAPFLWTLAIVILEIHIRRERANQVNIERHYVALPTPAVSEEDGVTRVISYKRDFVRVKLVQKMEVTRNTALFVFELPLRAELCTSPGHHVILRRQTRKEVVCRPYTPVTELVRYFGHQGSTNAKLQAMNLPGTVALAIKRYQHGAMSSWLHDSVKIGDTVEMMGPSGGFYYMPNQYRSIGLVAGGTGLTPLLSVVMAALTNQSDQTAVKILYAASSEEDIMFHEELEQLAHQYPHKFTVKFVAGSGRITRALLHEYLPSPSDENLIAVCGPVGFCTTVQNQLAKLKYEEHMTFTFGETA